MIGTSQRAVAFCRRLAHGSAILSIIGGVLILIGWWLGIEFLKTALPGLGPTSPKAALAFSLAGCAIYLLLRPRAVPARRQAWLACIPAGLVGIIGVIGMAEVLREAPSALDRWLIMQALPTPSGRGYTPPIVSLDLLLLSCALFVTPFRPKSEWVPQIPALLIVFTALVAIAGYFYDIAALYQSIWYAGSAVPSMLLLLVLAVGTLCLRPDGGVMRVMTATSVGGSIARWLILPVLVLPLLMNGLEAAAESRGLIPHRFGWMLDAAGTVFLLGGAILGMATALHRKDIERMKAENDLRQSEERYRALIESSPDGIVVKDRFRIDFANTAAKVLVGARQSDDVVGHSPWRFLHPDSRGEFKHRLCRVVEGGATLPRSVRAGASTEPG